MDKLSNIIEGMQAFSVALEDAKRMISTIQEKVDTLISDFKSNLLQPEVRVKEEKPTPRKIAFEEKKKADETVLLTPMSAKTSTPMSVGKCAVRKWENMSATMSDTSSQFSNSSSRFFECNKDGYLQRTRLPQEWWKERRDANEGEIIDWERDARERNELRDCLLLREGKRRQNSTYDELEAMLTKWTGRLIKWTILKRGRATNGKMMMSIKLRSMEDRQKVLDMKDDIAEEGFFYVGEALSYVERKERWRMLEMSHRLRAEGYYVAFENRRIRVNDECWKYEWASGWKRVDS